MPDNGNICFEEPLASRLSLARGQARHKRRITYDCMNGIVRDCSTVVCKKGHQMKGLGEREGAPIFSILKGIRSSVCVGCLDYDEETAE